jgi:hypothetical protein
MPRKIAAFYLCYQNWLGLVDMFQTFETWNLQRTYDTFDFVAERNVLMLKVFSESRIDIYILLCYNYIMDSPEFVIGGEFEFGLGVTDMARRGFERLNDEVASVNTARLVAEVQEEARTMMAGLKPTNDEQAERLNSWKGQISNFTPVDAVNFRIYAGESTPTLTDKEPTVGMPKRELLDLHGNKPIEFRFGHGGFQEGYYDNDDVSEARLAPVAANEYQQRRDSLVQRIGYTAAAHGFSAYLGTEHINVSAFRGEEPVLGDPARDIAPYQAAAAGLVRVLGDGILYNPQSDNIPDSMKIGFFRTSNVRVVPGRLELRTNQIPALRERNTSITHLDSQTGQRFMVSGMRYGLMHAIPEDISRVDTLSVTAAAPAADYDRVQDLSLQRLLGGLKIDNQLRLSLIETAGRSAFNRLAGGRVEEAVLPEDIETFVAGLEFSNDGHVKITEKGFADFIQEFRGEHVTGSPWDSVTVETINERLRSIAVTPSKTVHWNGTVSPRADGGLFNLERAAASIGTVDHDKYNELVAYNALHAGK